MDGPLVVVAGHVCLDITPSLDRPPNDQPGSLTEIGPVRIAPGGCVGNTGDELARLGIEVRLCADVGDDAAGSVLQSQLSAAGAGAVHLRRRPELTTSYSIVVEHPGSDRLFWHHVGANAGFDGSEVDLTNGQILHLGYPPLLPRLVSAGGGLWVDLLQRARQAGMTTSTDLAVLDPQSPQHAEDWPALLASVGQLTDVLSPSVDDVESLLGPQGIQDIDDVGRLATGLLKFGHAVVLVTDGARGLGLATAGTDRLSRAGAGLRHLTGDWADRTLVSSPQVIVQQGTTGAGDAATAGLLSALINGHPPDDALALAGAAAASRMDRNERATRVSAGKGWNP